MINLNPEAYRQAAELLVNKEHSSAYNALLSVSNDVLKAAEHWSIYFQILCENRAGGIRNTPAVALTRNEKAMLLLLVAEYLESDAHFFGDADNIKYDVEGVEEQFDPLITYSFFVVIMLLITGVAIAVIV